MRMCLLSIAAIVLLLGTAGPTVAHAGSHVGYGGKGKAHRAAKGLDGDDGYGRDRAGRGLQRDLERDDKAIESGRGRVRADDGDDDGSGGKAGDDGDDAASGAKGKAAKDSGDAD